MAIEVVTNAPGAVRISLIVPSTGALTLLTVPSKFLRVAITSPFLTTEPGVIFISVTLHCLVPRFDCGETAEDRFIPFRVVNVDLLFVSMS